MLLVPNSMLMQPKTNNDAIMMVTMTIMVVVMIKVPW